MQKRTLVRSASELGPSHKVIPNTIVSSQETREILTSSRQHNLPKETNTHVTVQYEHGQLINVLKAVIQPDDELALAFIPEKYDQELAKIIHENILEAKANRARWDRQVREWTSESFSPVQTQLETRHVLTFVVGLVGMLTFLSCIILDCLMHSEII